MSLYPHACKSIHVVMWECDTRTCIELCLISLLLGELSPVACWRMNWRAAWRACGHEKQRQHSGENHTHTHLYTLLTFPQNHRRDTLSTARWAPPVCQPVGPPPVQSQKGTLLSPQRGKIQFCNSTSLFSFLSHSLKSFVHWAACYVVCNPTVRTDEGGIFLIAPAQDFWSNGKMCLSKQKHQATVNQWANSFLKSTIRMHICFLALKRKRLHSKYWFMKRGRGWKALFKKRKKTWHQT